MKEIKLNPQELASGRELTFKIQLCHRLCAESPLKGRKNALVLIGKLNFRTQRILEGSTFPQIPILSCTGESRVPLQSLSLTKISLRMSPRAPSHPPPPPLQETAAKLPCHPRLPLMSVLLFMTLCAFKKEGSREWDQAPV